MIGSLITRGLVMIFGYAYPAYECYKSVEMNKPDIEQLRFWCQYWILVAMLTVCEKVGDLFIGWVPMYGEAKLAFFIYLWFPKTKGTRYVYDSFFRPYVAKHETDIDRNLLELRTRAGDLAILYWQKAASYGQTRVFDILQYIASQSSPARPAQVQPQATRSQKPTAPPTGTSVAATTKPQDIQSSSATSASSSSSKDQEDATEEVGPSQDSKAAAAPAPTALNAQKTTSTQSLVRKSSTTSDSTEEHVMQVDSSQKAQPEDTVMDENLRVTRARLRRTRGAAISK